MSNRLLKQRISPQVILRFILRCFVQPCGRILRGSLVTPRLCRGKECVAGDVFRNFYLFKPETAAEDSNDFSVLGSEKMGDEIIVGHTSFQVSGSMVAIARNPNLETVIKCEASPGIPSQRSTIPHRCGR